MKSLNRIFISSYMMIKTIYGKKLLMIATITVLLTGLMLVVTLDDAEAKGNKIKIVITGTAGNDFIIVDERGNKIICNLCAGLTVTGPVTGPVTDTSSSHGDSEVWTVNPGAGNAVDDKYEINGNGGTDRIIIDEGSATDNDKYKIQSTAGILDRLQIGDGAGDDKYEIKGSVFHFEYFDGPGKDKLTFKG